MPLKAFQDFKGIVEPLELRDRWVEYSQAKDVMFTHINIPEAPWFTLEAFTHSFVIHNTALADVVSVNVTRSHKPNIFRKKSS